jgi:D-3-phosphoglycerate dehydrogenase
MVPVYDEYSTYFNLAGMEVIIPEVKERLTEGELMKFAGEIDGTISGDDQYSTDVLEAMAPRLKVISKWGTGIDSIDLSAADKFGIKVFNTPDAFTDAVADTVLALILAFARKIPWMDEAMKAGHWEKIPGRALHECSLGVIGVGRIGKAVLQRAKPFGMQLLGNDIVPIDPRFTSETGVRMVDLEALLQESDFVSLNCDLNPSSKELINTTSLSKMRSRAVLINTARGGIVVEEALVAALKEAKIAGAGLDVFEDEPIPADSPLLKMENVLLAPHNANSSPKAWKRVHQNTIRNLFNGLGLDPPL